MQSNETESTTAPVLTFLKRAAAKVFRGFLWLLALLALLGAAAYAYYLYEEYSELTYMTSDSCVKHNAGTQLCEEKDGDLYLRQIEPQNNRMSVSYLVDDPKEDSYSYNYKSFWFDECTDGLKIETDKSYSNGDPYILTCSTQAQRFLSRAAPARLSVGFAMEIVGNVTMNSDGFKIDHDYSYADYSPLQRKLALSNSNVAEKRLARQSGQEQERLAQAKLEEQERLRLEQERLAREKRDARERLAQKQKQEQQRLAWASEKRACDDRNVVAKRLFEDKLRAAKEALSARFAVILSCESERGGPFPDWCSRYAFTITNTSDLPIKYLEIGYENRLQCAANPEFTHRISKRIEPSREYKSHFDWSTYGGSSCSRLADVEFDVTFNSEQC